jgi:hypothetical protein
MAMTIRDLILSIEVEEDQAIKERDRALSSAKFVLERAKSEGRVALTDDERADVDEQMSKRNKAEANLKAVRAKLESAKQIQAAEAAVDKQLDERDGGETGGNSRDTAAARRPSYDRVARIGREERTYNPETGGRGGEIFLRDILKQALYRDVEAERRLGDHMREERVERGGLLETRAVGTGAFAGLTVPQYLTDLYAPNAAALRPFADVCNHHDLPADGMTMNISKITTATGAALQASENSAVQETNADDTLLTENVQTIAGQQTISRQAIDRGTGVESSFWTTCSASYATKSTTLLLNQATTGLSAVATSNAYTDASPTGPELYPKILGAASGVDTALLGFGTPDVAVMHSRRWAGCSRRSPRPGR